MTQCDVSHFKPISTAKTGVSVSEESINLRTKKTRTCSREISRFMFIDKLGILPGCLEQVHGHSGEKYICQYNLSE